MAEQVLPIILASGSPRRQQLLRALGIPFEVDVSGIDERAIPFRTPREYAIKAAYAKATDVASRHILGRIVIAADTIVVLGDKIYGKPESESEAASFLEELSGKPHQVITGVAIQEVGRSAILDAVVSRVHMRPLSSEEIQSLVDTGEPMDKAGAYAIQGKMGPQIVSRIEGDYFNVVGLPVARLLDMMSSFIDVAVYRPKLHGLTPQSFDEGL